MGKGGGGSCLEAATKILLPQLHLLLDAQYLGIAEGLADLVRRLDGALVRAVYAEYLRSSCTTSAPVAKLWW